MAEPVWDCSNDFNDEYRNAVGLMGRDSLVVMDADGGWQVSLATSLRTERTLDLQQRLCLTLQLANKSTVTGGRYTSFSTQQSL